MGRRNYTADGMVFNTSVFTLNDDEVNQLGWETKTVPKSYSVKGKVPNQVSLSLIQNPKLGDLYLVELDQTKWVWSGEEWTCITDPYMKDQIYQQLEESLTMDWMMGMGDTAMLQQWINGTNTVIGRYDKALLQIPSIVKDMVALHSGNIQSNFLDEFYPMIQKHQIEAGHAYFDRIFRKLLVPMMDRPNGTWNGIYELRMKLTLLHQNYVWLYHHLCEFHLLLCDALSTINEDVKSSSELTFRVTYWMMPEKKQSDTTISRYPILRGFGFSIDVIGCGEITFFDPYWILDATMVHTMRTKIPKCRYMEFYFRGMDEPQIVRRRKELRDGVVWKPDFHTQYGVYSNLTKREKTDWKNFMLKHYMDTIKTRMDDIHRYASMISTYPKNTGLGGKVWRSFQM